MNNIMDYLLYNLFQLVPLICIILLVYAGYRTGKGKDIEHNIWV
jgi:hypothetical protein